jgi:hypothetical protein
MQLFEGSLDFRRLALIKNGDISTMHPRQTRSPQAAATSAQDGKMFSSEESHD